MYMYGWILFIKMTEIINELLQRAGISNSQRWYVSNLVINMLEQCLDLCVNSVLLRRNADVEHECS